MFYIFLTGAIFIFIFLIQFQVKAIDAISQFNSVIIPHQNFGWETLSHTLKLEISLFWILILGFENVSVSFEIFDEKEVEKKLVADFT